MATYVTSDAHGHLRALDRALELAAPGAGDTLYVVGDMVDRGPDPVGVLKLVRDLPGARVLMGNHERLLLDSLLTDNDVNTMTWEMNGGFTTARGLDNLPRDEAGSLISWIAHLPLFDVVEVEDRFSAGVPAGTTRSYIIVHAGIEPVSARAFLSGHGEGNGSFGATGRAQSFASASVDELKAMMAAQDPDDLLWIREGFWNVPTGLVDSAGRGPVVVAGHTPTVLLGMFAHDMCGAPFTEESRGRVVEVGACADTGGEADRIDIDCSAAAGYPHGCVGVMRLEDRASWVVPVQEGE